MGIAVEIWSDVMCPFCWLGKRRFDMALEQSGHASDVDMVYRSFQLNPSLPADVAIRSEEYLTRAKGIDASVARQMHDRVARMGAQVGLEYRFDRVLVVNTFDAHRLLHFALEHGVQKEMSERLFRAHFSKGRNVADSATLVELAGEVGLEPAATRDALASDAHADDVRADITEALDLGVQGVPFFVFDRKYAVSGAQEVGVFSHVIRRVIEEAAAFQQAGSSSPSASPNAE